jgi:SAM-dependent methyltransferase
MGGRRRAATGHAVGLFDQHHGDAETSRHAGGRLEIGRGDASARAVAEHEGGRRRLVEIEVDVRGPVRSRDLHALGNVAIRDTGRVEELPEYVRRNRAQWDVWAGEYVEPGRAKWQEEPTWGLFDVPDRDLEILPERVDGLDTIELGCGTAYVSAWLAKRGARPVGIDNSEVQLSTARALQAEFGLEFPLLHGNAEAVPYPDASFDLAISEYGASIWCDPYKWIPEAARLLRPGGRLIFLVNSPLAMMTIPDEEDGVASDRLLRPYFGLHRLEWSDDDSVGFVLPHGETIELLRGCGLTVERLVEIRPPNGSTTRFSFIPLQWAQKWPCEEVWVAGKPPGPHPHT